MNNPIINLKSIILPRLGFLPNLKRRLYRNKLLIPAISGLALLVLTTLTVRTLNDKNLNTAPTDSRAAETLSTGDLYIPPNPEVVLQLQVFNQLVGLLPLSTPQYSLKFDHPTDTIQVLLFVPHDTSKLAFQNWLKANGYGNLPREYFTYLLSPSAAAPTPPPPTSTLKPTPTIVKSTPTPTRKLISTPTPTRSFIRIVPTLPKGIYPPVNPAY